MKKILMFILLFLAFSSTSYAKTGTVFCTNGNTDPLNIRDSIGGTPVGGIPCNGIVEVLDDNAGTSSSCSLWYKVNYNNTIGYSCGDYISINKNTTYKSSTSDNIYDKNNYLEPIDGDGTISCFEDTGNLPLRETAGGASTGKTVSCGEVVKINSSTNGNSSCGYYYNVTDSNGNTGYVCGYFVNTTKLSDFAIEYYNNSEVSLEEYYNTLREANFPDSYLPYLAEIHARHPNYIFNAEKVNLNFDDVVNNESAYGRNLLQGSAFSTNYFSMDINTFNVLGNSFSQYPTEIGWFNASSEAIAFYLDPRNYLNEKYIFAFEALQYNEEHDEGTISKILSGQTFWPTIYTGFEGNVSSDIVTATNEIGISSVHIASRIKQEISSIGIGDPRLGGIFNYDGVDYSGYYNFFNISVYGDNKITRGMVYAKNHGWDTPYNGIYGGASYIYNDYVNLNQDTMYYEKFDVSTSDGHYTHQYMQNLAAPVQETNTTYNSYVELGDYLGKTITFTIPVYEGMSNYAVTSPRVGNPNNYLNDITIDGVSISGFSYDNFNYDVSVPYEKESIVINASKISGTASVSGDGTIDNDSDNKKIDIVVTSESGRSRTYTINITRLPKREEGEIEVPKISDIMNSSGVKYNDDYIFGINENTSMKGLADNIKKIDGSINVIIKDKNDNNKEDDILKTGDIVTISNGIDTKKYTILIYGDINGDGIIDKDDCLNILRQLNGYTNLENVYKLAADAKRDGVIDKDDCLAILRHMNKYTNLNE